MNRKIICSSLAALILSLSSVAMAKPQIEIKIATEKETVVVKNGQKTKRLIPVKKVTSGDTIQYTITYKNSSTEIATNIVISDPIPEGTTYIAGSASETGDLAFSIDGGKTFNKAPLLTYEVATGGNKKEKITAGSDKYTHIRWIIDTLAAGSSGKVSFKVIVK